MIDKRQQFTFFDGCKNASILVISLHAHALVTTMPSLYIEITAGENESLSLVISPLV
jgi:hypothetical protein